MTTWNKDTVPILIPDAIRAPKCADWGPFYNKLDEEIRVPVWALRTLGLNTTVTCGITGVIEISSSDPGVEQVMIHNAMMACEIPVWTAILTTYPDSKNGFEAGWDLQSPFFVNVRLRGVIDREGRLTSDPCDRSKDYLQILAQRLRLTKAEYEWRDCPDFLQLSSEDADRARKVVGIRSVDSVEKFYVDRMKAQAAEEKTRRRRK